METRREAIKTVAGVAVAGSAILNASPAPLFFSRDEYVMVDELTEMIIPADEHSSGARGADVVSYIDRALSIAVEPVTGQLWRDGLTRVDAMIREQHGVSLLDASPAQRTALLTSIAKNETEPKSLEERFFVLLKHETARVYYTSDIGIHKEMEYKGNTLLDKFVGYEGETA